MTLFTQPPHPAVRFVVAIPACNEERQIVRTLEALACQTDGTGHPLCPNTFETLLLVNNSTDNTANVARTFAQSHTQFTLHIADVCLPPGEAHAGGARRMVMDSAAERFCFLERPCGLICSTDADTRPVPDWLHQTGVEAAQGADAVCGRISVEREDGPRDPARLYSVQDTAYRLLLAELEGWIDPPPGDPLPRHFQHFGASLAVTAQALHTVGGVPSLPALEDIALFDALVGHNLCVRHSPRVKVETSGRRVGRTQMGLSTQLAEWDTLHGERQPLLVDDPAAWECHFVSRRACRNSVPPSVFADIWSEARQTLPSPPLCEASTAIHWLRQRLRVLRAG